MVRTHIRDSAGDRVFFAAVNSVLFLLLVAVGIPMIFVLSASFSSADAVIAGKVFLWPVDFSLAGYKAVFEHTMILTAYKNSMFYLIVGTTINVTLTMFAAYPLSRRSMPGGRFVMLLFVFTMIFNGGLIPTYMLVSNLKMLNTVWAMIIPGAVSAYNMVVACTFIKSTIPEDLFEAAQIDGCSDLQFFFRFVIPLSKAVIAVISLYYAIGHWNAYFNALIYLTDKNLYPLQIVLKDILISNQIDANMVYDPELAAAKEGLSELLKYSLIVVSVIPMLIIYPFVQKHFVNRIKLILPGPVTVKYTETEDVTGGESVKTPKLFARNSDVVVCPLAAKVSVTDEAGKRSTVNDDALGALALGKTVSYTLRAEGAVSSLTFLPEAAVQAEKKYNANELIFAETTGGSFGIEQGKTVSVCLPKSGGASDDDLKVFTELQHEKRYNVHGFVLDEDTQMVDLVVIRSDMDASGKGNITSASDVAMVSGVAQVYGNDGETAIKVDLITGGKEVSHLVSMLVNGHEEFLTLGAGDLIAFSLDGFDQLNGFELIQSRDNYYDDSSGEDTENEKFCGIVEDLHYRFVAQDLNRWVNQVDVCYEDKTESRPYRAYLKNAPPVFVIERSGKPAAGKFEDIQIGDRIFLSVKTALVRAIVVKR